MSKNVEMNISVKDFDEFKKSKSFFSDILNPKKKENEDIKFNLEKSLYKKLELTEKSKLDFFNTIQDCKMIVKEVDCKDDDIMELYKNKADINFETINQLRTYIENLNLSLDMIIHYDAQAMALYNQLIDIRNNNKK